MAITQVISTIPEAGHRGVDARDAFVTKQEAFQDALTDTFVGQINTFTTQANTLETNVNTKEATVVAKEALVSPHYTAIDGVYANTTNINTVAGISSNITTVAGISSNVTTVATNNTNVTTNATNITSINTNATNITAIQNASANATAAATSAALASVTANVTKWISGTSYTQGANVWSPITFQTYRAKANTSGTTDPSSDTTNWQVITVDTTIVEW